ncbi:hypothetical protein SAMN05216227_10187 [Pseudorhodobacter antarcticus]|uniref:Uncharacterized protein n=1 Tax=Pseudorhodobacter antarcticus TaxID=1077947 RepID=A0A1H8HSV6_9RHOB|nr:hypothetical protein [Pseudorhodobacter antarcticus]SEN59252.1 hypothetical protein SAMN05216227_10187 [Pseudorhodobacter antarcticus]
MTDTPFTTPRHMVPNWEDLTENERGWIEFIRIISGGRDPGINLERVQALREVLERKYSKR